MRNLLFAFVSGFFAMALLAIESVSQHLKKVVGTVGFNLMKLIDKERCAVVESVKQQMEDQVNENGTTPLQLQHLELQLLSSCHQLRDHASENGGWTREHEAALEAVGNCLINDMQWDLEDVHRYMKDLIESVDGFKYGP